MTLDDSAGAVESVFRAKYGELCASLLSAFGYQRFDMVEEALQSAFERALERWPKSSVPGNPAGWLYAVARNSCLEALRHAAVVDRANAVLKATRTEVVIPDAEFARAMPGGLDDFATMILLCCNPDLSERARLCLMLKAGCGMTVREIARLLDMADEAVKKTLTRARARIAQDAEALGALDQQRITTRYPVVVEVIYALFTEGYAAGSGDLPLRRDVAVQALHLGDVLLGSNVTPAEARPGLQAVTALMLLQLARFDARVGPDGVPVRLQEQDRTRWNQPMIRAGLDALASATSADTLSPYHLEARIAAEHSTSATFGDTDWSRILELYDQLLAFKDTAAVRLNRVVALKHARGPLPALEQLDAMAVDASRPAATAFLRHTIRADILEALGRVEEARRSWEAALAAAPTAADRAFVASRVTAPATDVPETAPRASS